MDPAEALVQKIWCTRIKETSRMKIPTSNNFFYVGGAAGICREFVIDNIDCLQTCPIEMLHSLFESIDKLLGGHIAPATAV